MSSPITQPQLPQHAEFAWPDGDIPGALVFDAQVEPKLHAALCAVIAQHGRAVDEITALSKPNGAIGRYRVAGNDGAWFVRISTRWEHAELEKEIGDYLLAAGIAVNHLEVAGAPFEFGGTIYRLDIRPLLEGRHFNHSLEDLRALALLLNRTHDVLKSFPQSETVRQLAEKRFTEHGQVRAHIKMWHSTGQWQRLHPDASRAQELADWYARMIEEFDPRFDLDAGAQVLHAQVHRGNVVFQSDGGPVLLDLEKAVYTFATPAWDWAHLVQRFCLFDEPSPAALLIRLDAISKNANIPSGLVRMMQRIAWMSMTILISDHALYGVSAATAEFEKFVRLEEQARRYSQALGGS